MSNLNPWFYVGCYLAACGFTAFGFVLGATVTRAKLADNVIDLDAERRKRRVA